MPDSGDNVNLPQGKDRCGIEASIARQGKGSAREVGQPRGAGDFLAGTTGYLPGFWCLRRKSLARITTAEEYSS